jgi:hypothetical protein
MLTRENARGLKENNKEILLLKFAVNSGDNLGNRVLIQ